VRTTREQTRRTYDRISATYDLTEGVLEAGSIRKALALAAVTKGECVFEVGPGTGVALERLRRAVGDEGVACGVDLSPRMLQHALHARELHGALLVEGDAVALPLATARFDVAFMSFVLELFPTDDIDRVLRELRRVLRPGGRLVNLSLSRESPNLMTRLYERGHALMPRLLDCRPIYAARSIRAAGFEIVLVRPIRIWGLPADIVLARKPALETG
jgi:demethylmenaquinone methyltransferase/2-methoxy-6-polyprenyl-1,4-benzoquinol methylase